MSKKPREANHSVFVDDDDLSTPWKRPAPNKGTLSGPLPETLTITLANLVDFEKAQLSQPVINRLIRLAAFQNPEFYRAQAMHMSVRDKSRVIGCAENFPHHVGLPRGRIWDPHLTDARD